MADTKLLAAITAASKKGTVTELQVMNAYHKGKGTKAPARTTTINRVNLPSVLSFIGGTIVLIGIVIFIMQNWEQLNTAARISATLGAGILSYIVAAILHNRSDARVMAQPFFSIAGIVLPIGIAVTLTEFTIDPTSALMQTWIALALAGVFAVSAVVFRTAILPFFSIVYGSWAFFALTNWIFNEYTVTTIAHFDEYRLLIVSICYLILGHVFTRTRFSAHLTDFLYFFGTVGFLGTTLALGGWNPNQQLFWELSYPLYIFGAMYLGVILQRRLFIILGSLFLMGYILKITGEYFTNNFGWPLSLIICGILLIIVGYISVIISRKYVAR